MAAVWQLAIAICIIKIQTTISTISVLIMITIIVLPIVSTAKTVTNTITSGITTKSFQMGPITQCLMSEHTCTNGKCIPMSKFCDNFNDCGDSSDEPRFCTRKLNITI